MKWKRDPIDEDFINQVLRKVMKRVNNIIRDKKLKEKLAFLNEDDIFNQSLSKVAIERYKETEMRLQKGKDPSFELMLV
jgi:hypothetical protein